MKANNRFDVTDKLVITVAQGKVLDKEIVMYRHNNKAPNGIIERGSW